MASKCRSRTVLPGGGNRMSVGLLVLEGSVRRRGNKGALLDGEIHCQYWDH